MCLSNSANTKTSTRPPPTHTGARTHLRLIIFHSHTSTRARCTLYITKAGRRKTAEYFQPVRANHHHRPRDVVTSLDYDSQRAMRLQGTYPLGGTDVDVHALCLVPLQRRRRAREVKKGKDGATKPFGSSDRSITISREYKCLREQPTDAVQFGVGPALPFNLVASPLLISFHRPAARPPSSPPPSPRRCNFSFSLVRRSKRMPDGRSARASRRKPPSRRAENSPCRFVPPKYRNIEIFRRSARHSNQRHFTGTFICRPAAADRHCVKGLWSKCCSLHGFATRPGEAEARTTMRV